MDEQTKQLIKRMRVGPIQAVVEGDRVCFIGGRYGRHSLALDVSPPSRIASHWEGYLEANGIDPKHTVGGVYWFDGRGYRHLERIVAVTRKGARGTTYGRTVYRSGRLGAEGIIAQRHDPRSRR